MKRAFDLILSLLTFILLLPFFILLSISVLFSGRGGVFYLQVRIGKDQKPFRLIKFRTMRPQSDISGQLTIGEKDPRITRTGYFLRRYKLDELPQLINILKGDMSIVGPRPEVPEYVSLYTPEQLKVLKVRPGLTDYASLEYLHENEILGKAIDPYKTYIETIMPAKLDLNLQYIQQQSLLLDIKIIIKTIWAIIR